MQTCVVDLLVDLCRRACRHASVRLSPKRHVHPWFEASIDTTNTGMCVDMHVDLCVDLCVDVRVDMRVLTCV